MTISLLDDSEEPSFSLSSWPGSSLFLSGSSSSSSMGAMLGGGDPEGNLGGSVGGEGELDRVFLATLGFDCFLDSVCSFERSEDAFSCVRSSVGIFPLGTVIFGTLVCDSVVKDIGRV